ncbi:hypothetical protein KIN20_030032 [Parelaphostrongylus tenuis]|uniref:Uncharacterized protein n=1 Tax=Parelaphostrongylus tenuis TaxID=148309 RepID=A0AAD5R3A2_PARTN|nr:hypothetical protein KIN20_030032 [Parelaphostrongylus tenuis]
MMSVLATFSTVRGCGVMPAGQASMRSFNVTGFTLPVNMVYSTVAQVRARVPGIAFDSASAQGFVHRLVTQTVFETLERQGRSALLPDPVISAILSQLEVRTTYVPMLCQGVVDMTELDDAKPQNCIIVSNTVTGICTQKMNQ